MKICYTLFNTELGKCAIAWEQASLAELEYPIIALQLPEKTVEITKSRIIAKVKNQRPEKAGEVPEAIKAITEKIQEHLKGNLQNFRQVAIKPGSGKMTEFTKKIYAATREIAPGKTKTYGQLAATTGHPGAARAVGRVMAQNLIPLIVPCHRVLASDGKLRGFSAYGGLKTKAKILRLEGYSTP